MVLQSLADGCPDAALTTGDKCDACHALALLTFLEARAHITGPAALQTDQTVCMDAPAAAQVRLEADSRG
ncbi:hypothetical protein SKB0092_12660 [Roseomonas mucosa]